MNWKIISHSVMGTSHEKGNIPCQDYGSYKVINNILIGVVSDGAGSAKHSQIGSQLTVETTINNLTRWFKNISQEYPDIEQNPFDQSYMKQVFQENWEIVIQNLQEKTKEGYSYKDLSCTLLAFIATPNWIAAMQIGDGFIVVHSQEEDSNYELLFPPSKGEYANQTVFVTSQNALSELQSCVINAPQKFIFASTDGLEKLAIKYINNSYLPYKDFFQPFEEDIENNKLEEEKESVLAFLNSQDVNKRTDDDKTVLICLFDENFVNSTPNQPPKITRPGKARKPNSINTTISSLNPNLLLFILGIISFFWLSFLSFKIAKLNEQISVQINLTNETKEEIKNLQNDFKSNRKNNEKSLETKQSK